MKIKILTNLKFGIAEGESFFAGDIVEDPDTDLFTEEVLSDTRIIMVLEAGETVKADKPVKHKIIKKA